MRPPKPTLCLQAACCHFTKIDLRLSYCLPAARCPSPGGHADVPVSSLLPSLCTWALAGLMAQKFPLDLTKGTHGAETFSREAQCMHSEFGCPGVCSCCLDFPLFLTIPSGTHPPAHPREGPSHGSPTHRVPRAFVSDHKKVVKQQKMSLCPSCCCTERCLLDQQRESNPLGLLRAVAGLTDELWELLLISGTRTGAVSSPTSQLLLHEEAVPRGAQPRRGSVLGREAILLPRDGPWHTETCVWTNAGSAWSPCARRGSRGQFLEDSQPFTPQLAASSSRWEVQLEPRGSQARSAPPAGG